MIGTIGFELLGSSYYVEYAKHNPTYVLINTLEETFEMLGIALFIYALLDCMGRNFDATSLQVQFDQEGQGVFRS